MGSTPTLRILLIFMRHFVIISALFFVGCVQSVPTSAEIELLDNQLESRYDDEVIVEPDWNLTLDVDVEEPPTFDVSLDTCMCEWQAWEDDRGMLCMGVVCSNACPPEVSECREVRRACVPQM